MPNRHTLKLSIITFISLICGVVFLLFLDLNGAQTGKYKLVKVAKGFKLPLQVVFPPGNAQSMYVVEQEGRIYRVLRGQKSLFLNITKDVRSKGNEEGLLSLAFHPDYREDANGRGKGRLYLNYTAGKKSHTHIVEYQFTKGRVPKVIKRSKRILLRIKQPYSNHNGGLLLFGPDKKLYIGTGDGGAGGDPRNNGQNPKTLLGKMLRIDPKPSNGRPYTIPGDNPFLRKSGYRPEIYALGLRNPWRFSFDRQNGRLYVGDVGQDEQEEISLITKGSNLGWRLKEGFLCYNPKKNCHRSYLTDPIYAYNHELGRSVIGGYVYRGQALKALKGYYIFGDFISGTIWALPLNKIGRPFSNSSSNLEVLLKRVGFISSFGEDPSGEIYITEFKTGAVFKMVVK